jgi:hypothetical protein
VKLTPTRREGRGWPHYILWGRVRTSTAALLAAFIAVWWLYATYQPEAAAPEGPATQMVPPGFIPDPSYTWVPRTEVRDRTTTTRTTPTTTETTTPTETTEPSTSETSPTSPPSPTSPTSTTPASPGPLPFPGLPTPTPIPSPAPTPTPIPSPAPGQGPMSTPAAPTL